MIMMRTSLQLLSQIINHIIHGNAVGHSGSEHKELGQKISLHIWGLTVVKQLCPAQCHLTLPQFAWSLVTGGSRCSISLGTMFQMHSE